MTPWSTAAGSPQRLRDPSRCLRHRATATRADGTHVNGQPAVGPPPCKRPEARPIAVTARPVLLPGPPAQELRAGDGRRRESPGEQLSHGGSYYAVCVRTPSARWRRHRRSSGSVCASPCRYSTAVGRTTSPPRSARYLASRRSTHRWVRSSARTYLPCGRSPRHFHGDEMNLILTVGRNVDPAMLGCSRATSASSATSPCRRSSPSATVVTHAGTTLR